MESTARRPLDYVALLLLCVSAVLLIPVEWYVAGALVWLAAAVAVWRSGDRKVQLRLGTLLGCIALLAAAPINTDTSPRHFLTLGLPFLAVIVGPAILLGLKDPGVIRYRFWPTRFRWLDLVYVAISFPLANWIIDWYFTVSAHMPTQWYLPPELDEGAVTRLFWGINCVGIWDELFFVNTVYAVMRSLFSFRVANLAQAVIYTAVLNDMAFTGIGPIVVYLFALTQGSMFEESENLLYVLIVHLVVDYFLVQAIVAHYYPGVDMSGILLH